ncbi:MAG: hypothetical protein ACK5YI_05685 [Rhodospirillales bacterium]|jgi:hypothetical protein
MTAQEGEILLHRGEELTLHTDVLHGHLKKRCRTARPRFVWSSTANYRSYVGTWTFIDGLLHIVGIDARIETPTVPRRATLADVFPRNGDRPRAADWFTGQLHCPEGERIRYVHQGWASAFERDRIFDVERGRLKQEWLVLNPPEPIIYRIDAEGRRTCDEAMRWWDPHPVPDPLEGAPVTEAHLVWGRRPAAERWAGLYDPPATGLVPDAPA